MSDEYTIDLADWPNCSTPDCDAKACLWVGAGLCSRCSSRPMGQFAYDMMYAITRAPDGSWNGCVGMDFLDEIAGLT